MQQRAGDELGDLGRRAGGALALALAAQAARQAGGQRGAVWPQDAQQAHVCEENAGQRARLAGQRAPRGGAGRVARGVGQLLRERPQGQRRRAA